MNTQLQPLKGFRDYYPVDKALLEYIFTKFRDVAKKYGFEQYDGPIVEPYDLYANKSSDELLNEQSFNLVDRDGKKLLLRPEMTPSLARMVAARSMELPFPIRWTNIGRRFRYEAPQKGRAREFYQMDCDILGTDSSIADIELLSLIIDFFKSLGATKKDFEVRLNSREILAKAIVNSTNPDSDIKKIISIIDRKEKVLQEAFEKKLSEVGLKDNEIQSINDLLSDRNAYEKLFEDFLSLVPPEIKDYIVVDPCIVRGLDYYTGIVFEVKAKKGLTRSLLGGGRYANLVEKYDNKRKISGIGFATSNVVIEAFLKDVNLIPEVNSLPTKVLVTIFDNECASQSVVVAQKLRNNEVATEVYPDVSAGLKRQLEYANKKTIPFVIIIGPDEIKNKTVTLKNLSDRSQESLTVDELISKLKNL